MGYNPNAGYGSIIASGIAPKTFGKVFVVADADNVNIELLQELMGYDPEGIARRHATIESALAQCVAGRGDVIYVAPGHTETVSSAGAITLDIADVTIIGLGVGTSRPTITLDTANTATINVTAANVRIENMIFTANFADVVAVFTLTTAKNFQLDSCVFKATATNMNFLSIVDTNTTNNAADGLTVTNCKRIEPDAATLSFLDLDADMDQFVFQGNYLNLGVNTSDLPAIAIVATGKDLTNAMIGGMSREQGNVVIRLNDANPLLITADTTTANTGVVANNFVRHLDTAGELLVTAGTNFGYFENKATAAVDASGYILPVVDS